MQYYRQQTREAAITTPRRHNHKWEQVGFKWLEALIELSLINKNRRKQSIGPCQHDP